MDVPQKRRTKFSQGKRVYGHRDRRGSWHQLQERDFPTQREHNTTRIVKDRGRDGSRETEMRCPEAWKEPGENSSRS